jgi:excinuclease ABC subunit A
VPVFTDRSPSQVREAVASGAEPRYMSKFLGVKRHVLETFANSKSATMRQRVTEFMISVRCPVCGGKRLKPDALAVTFEGADITEISRMPLDDVARLMEHVLLPEWRSTEHSEDEYLPPEKRLAAQRLASELLGRLSPIIDLGLGYLTLDRTTSALSSGEFQRIRLATQVLSRLFGVVFVLDEPSAGLHPADTEALLQIHRDLRNSGNTVFYVEHSVDVIREADWIADIGPGAGASGGTVVYSGRIDGLREVEESVTRPYLFGGSNSAPDQPRERRVGDGRLTLHNVTRNNLSDVTVAFPLGAFTAITGVSGSGKSTLINHGIPDLLRADLASLTGETEADLETTSEDPLDSASPVTTAGRASGPADHVRRIVQVTQKPIGRTPRSNVATYTGVFDRIRSRFAATPEARRRHYGTSRFSFNPPSGRCPVCTGEGVIEVELLFLPTVHAPCTACGGTRYNAKTLEVRLDGKTLAEILAMSVSTAREFFDLDSDIVQHLDALLDVGLGYVSLGQSATELSGGEAQRVKLAAELRRAQLGDTLYLLDEPTSGLHPADSDRLIGHLQRLVDGGNTVIVVEHDMRVVAEADWVIDLGPGAGDAGGQVVAKGTPEEVSVNAASRTAPFLEAALVSRGQC